MYLLRHIIFNNLLQIFLVTFFINYVSGDIFGDLSEVTSKNNFTYSKNFLRLLNNNESNFRGNFTTKPPHKKWQVGRVSSKQHELVNMRWRKGKMIENMDWTTSAYRNVLDTTNYGVAKANFNEIVSSTSSQVPLTFLPGLGRLMSTPSFIEFYYLENGPNERFKYSASNSHTVSKVIRGKVRNLNDFRFIHPDSATIRFPAPDQGYKMPILPIPFMDLARSLILRKNKTSIEGNHNRKDNFHKDFTYTGFTQTYNSKKNIETTKHVYPHSVESLTDFSLSDLKTDSDKLAPSWDYNALASGLYVTTEKDFADFTDKNKIVSFYLNATTLYDKIKFFETYDKQTLQNYDDYDTLFTSYKPTKMSTTSNVIVEPTDTVLSGLNINLHKPRFSKKHMTEGNEIRDQNMTMENLIKPIAIVNPVIFNATSNDTFVNGSLSTPKRLFPHEYTSHQRQRSWQSNIAKWSDYPFIGVYIYEPSKVYCDAASISSHWLVTAAECLSKYLARSEREIQSAFVSYCSDNWWNHELIAYVKYSVIHPRYRSHDRTRKHLYNIGLIKVDAPMSSACYGWSPISLRSHPLVTEDKGSIAYAVGWGVNRLDYRKISSELPKVPLMVYENIVYSNSCPGNMEYSMSKELEDQGGTINVVCLSLPTYFGEMNDSIHGGLLLFEGKLVALYLQEERRSWGEQSAQYTGTWRLMPWILNVAREPEFEQFPDDI